MIKEKIKNKIIQALKKLKINFPKNLIRIETPKIFAFGDYSTSFVLKLSQNLKEDPLALAQKIKEKITIDGDIEKIDVVKPGFLNFWLNKKYLYKKLEKNNEGRFEFYPFPLGKNKKILIEYAQPNTHKLFHIGHLRNITLGEALARIFEASGNTVFRANYQGDVGLHIAKCLWAIKKSKIKIQNLKTKTLSEKIQFIGKMYTKGNNAYEESQKAKEEIIKINQQIYNQDKKILSLWQETRQWSLDYFEKIYQRLETKFNQLFFESEMTKRAVEICQNALKKGILKKSRGAVVFDGKKYNLDTRVFINSLGYPTYEGKELTLAEKEFYQFKNIDKAIHLTTPEQKSFFKVTFKVEELINPKKFKDKQYHLSYEWVNLKEGKMSSRKGNIVEANWLINKVKERILNQFKTNKEIAEKISVAATKYAFLKTSPQKPINFDIEESISLKGNSGPYILYTYVRTQSVLKKLKEKNLIIKDISFNLSKQEIDLLRFLNLFEESVFESAINLSPSFLSQYLYNLCQIFNLFYEQQPILKEKDKKIKTWRILLTKSSANIIKKGLNLLGIKTVDRM